MKRLILLFVWAFVAISTMQARADMIIKKDGGILEVYNIDISYKYIAYTKEPSPDSELGRVPAGECFAIKTADGEMKTIADASGATIQQPTSDPKETSAGPVRIPAHPAADNAELINRYNTSNPHHVKPNKNKDGKPDKADNLYKIFGFLESSMLSDSVLTISLELTYPYYYTGEWIWNRNGTGCL